MSRSAVTLAMLTLLGAACAPAQQAPPATLDATVRAFVTPTYAHGVPYDRARNLGAQAVPVLITLIDEPSMRPHRSNIVVTLGILGTGPSIKTVIDTIERGTGALDADEVRVRMDAITALGYAANVSTDPAVLTYLRDGLDTNVWDKRATWRLSDGSNAAARLRNRSVAALGLSGKPDALTALTALDSTIPVRGAPRSSLKALVEEAITTNQFIAANGLSKYYETFLK